ncbi:MAG: helix-turn-helix transcriptional regulator [Acidimicrobiia bacterium]|nr:helix-turn-helix transcriptional regulator [Acidimicrobiia bacterium]
MAVREGLLVLLGAGPRHGYGLKSAFERATGGVWPLNVGQVYTTLDRLERDGLVEPAEADEGQRAWQLTDEGRGELGAWWWVVPGEEPPPRDELVLKVLLAVAGDRDHALEVIGRQRDALLGLLARRRRQARGRRRDAGDPVAAELMVDVLVLRAEADLRWLDVCEERVSEAGAAGEPVVRHRGERSRRA